MNRSILILFFACVFSSAFSQGFDFGIKIGFNTTDFRDFRGENRTGFVGGVFATIKFDDNIAIQPEILYNQKGAKLDLGEVDLSYIDVPVLLNVYIFKGLHAQIGPKFGFVIGDDLPSEVTVNGVSQELETNSFDLDAVLGVGYKFPLGIRADVRYLYGLNDVLELETNNEGSKISVWQFSIGYSFL